MAAGSEEVFAGKQTPKLRAALDQLIGEAQAHLRRRRVRCWRTRRRRSRPVFLPLALVGRELDADVARRQRSVPAACDIEASDAVDIVAGVAVAAVSQP